MGWIVKVPVTVWDSARCPRAKEVSIHLHHKREKGGIVSGQKQDPIRFLVTLEISSPKELVGE